MSDIEIASMRPEHLDQVLDIERDSFRSPWSEKAFKSELDRPEVTEWFVALEDGVVIGYSGLLRVGQEGHITNLAVRRDRRRQGVGSELVSRLTDAAKRRGVTALTLEVRETNESAIRLYENAGFHVVGKRRRYYPEDDEDALIMWNYEL